MIKRYKIPIQGKVINDKPLTGAKDDPLCSMPIGELFEPVPERFGYICLEYDLDKEEVLIELDTDGETHNKLVDLLSQLKNIQKAKGWKLDKSNLEGK